MKGNRPSYFAINLFTFLKEQVHIGHSHNETISLAALSNVPAHPKM